MACSIVRCFWFDHWNCEPKYDSVNLHVVHLNIKKNNNIGVLCSVVVFAMSHKCNVSDIHQTYFVSDQIRLVVGFELLQS